jgi:outer membrane protein assembly factor BamB
LYPSLLRKENLYKRESKSVLYFSSLMMKWIIKILPFLAIFGQLQGQSNNWPIFRGTSDLCGRLDYDIPSSQKLIWSLATEGTTKSSPVMSDGMIFFGNDKGTLLAVGTDGKIKWKYESGNAIEAPPFVYGNNVLIGSIDGVVRAVNKLTGKLVWSYSSDNQIVGSVNAWNTGKRSGIIFGSYDYFLHCVDPVSGKLLWKLETENYVNGTPAVADNRIVFGGCDGIMRVTDPMTGKERDTINIGIYIAASPALFNQKAYFGDYYGNFYCLDLVTRRISWKVPAGENSGSILAIPAAGNNSVVIGNEDKYLYCFDASSGRQKWKYRTNNRIIGSAVLSPSKVLFGSMDGNIYMVGLSDGKKIWSFNAGAPISSSPAVTKERFYFLTEDGRLLAFGTK